MSKSIHTLLLILLLVVVIVLASIFILRGKPEEPSRYVWLCPPIPYSSFRNSCAALGVG